MAREPSFVIPVTKNMNSIQPFPANRPSDFFRARSQLDPSTPSLNGTDPHRLYHSQFYLFPSSSIPTFSYFYSLSRPQSFTLFFTFTLQPILFLHIFLVFMVSSHSCCRDWPHQLSIFVSCLPSFSVVLIETLTPTLQHPYFPLIFLLHFRFLFLLLFLIITSLWFVGL